MRINPHARLARLESLSCDYFLLPVVGFKISVPLVLTLVKLNIWVIEFAMASYEPVSSRCPASQLSSMKRRIDVRSVTEWSTKFSFAYGEMTINGSLGP